MATDPPPFELAKGINGLDKILLRESRGRSAEVYLYGSHVTSWKNENGEELLHLSSKAIFKPPKPIRGGIPLCFPQFSNFGTLESHGFVLPMKPPDHLSYIVMAGRIKKGVLQTWKRFQIRGRRRSDRVRE